MSRLHPEINVEEDRLSACNEETPHAQVARDTPRIGQDQTDRRKLR